jgi:UDPglucose 6-dehydrogenase
MEQAATLLDNVTYCDDAYEAMDGARRAVIVTEWDAFRALDFDACRELLKEPLLVDSAQPLRPQDVERHGFRYVAVGR